MVFKLNTDSCRIKCIENILLAQENAALKGDAESVILLSKQLDKQLCSAGKIVFKGSMLDADANESASNAEKNVNLMVDGKPLFRERI